MNQFDRIKTNRLFLRTLDIQDKEVFYRYRSMAEVYKYQSWCPKDIGEVEKFIEENRKICPNTRNTWLQLAICLQDGQLIGDMGIHFIEDNYQAEIGYTLSPAFQGKGYAIEAVKAILDYLFSKLKKHRITASVDPDNIKSIRLLENVGFRKEAHFIKSFRMNDQWYDDCIYAILTEEWVNS